MTSAFGLAWAQLRNQKKRVGAAAGGIVFAVVLMLVQMGFEDALMTSAGVHIRALDCDLIIVSPNYQYLLETGAFAERRLYQAGGDEHVDSVAPLYRSGLPWRDPETRQHRMIRLLAWPPRHGTFPQPVIDRPLPDLKHPGAG